MKQKSFIIIIICLFLQNCGFAPIYSDNKEKKISLNLVKIEGDDEMNSIVSTSLKRYSNNSSEKIYNLNITTDYKRNVLSKNKKGEICCYKSKTKPISNKPTKPSPKKKRGCDLIIAQNVLNKFAEGKLYYYRSSKKVLSAKEALKIAISMIDNNC